MGRSRVRLPRKPAPAARSWGNPVATQRARASRPRVMIHRRRRRGASPRAAKLRLSLAPVDRLPQCNHTTSSTASLTINISANSFTTTSFHAPDPRKHYPIERNRSHPRTLQHSFDPRFDPIFRIYASVYTPPFHILILIINITYHHSMNKSSPLHLQKKAGILNL